LADFPALDLRWRPGPESPELDGLRELIHAVLDEFEPQAIHNHESAEGWRVFFKTPGRRDAAAAALATSLGGRLLTVAGIEVPDEEWARRSQADLTAIRVGRIIVAPPWDEAAAPAHLPSYDLQPVPLSINHSADLVIVIDPSTGFGTGHHETTRLCLALIQSVDLAGRQVLDVGTGSGVLAIAAAKLGAAAVVAFDEDPEALRNARENVARNAVATVVDVREADLASFEAESAGLVVANLTGAVIQKYAGHLTRLVQPGGTLIVSGFAVSESADIARALGRRPEREMAEGDWAAGLFQL
jgi:ribosomal protein L11 methyltransferase